jgi:hypothetical protein
LKGRARLLDARSGKENQSASKKQLKPQMDADEHRSERVGKRGCSPISQLLSTTISVFTVLLSRKVLFSCGNFCPEGTQRGRARQSRNPTLPEVKAEEWTAEE